MLLFCGLVDFGFHIRDGLSKEVGELEGWANGRNFDYQNIRCS